MPARPPLPPPPYPLACCANCVLLHHRRQWADSAASWQCRASDSRMVQTWHSFKKFWRPSLLPRTPPPLRRGWHAPNEEGCLCLAPPLSTAVASSSSERAAGCSSPPGGPRHAGGGSLISAKHPPTFAESPPARLLGSPSERSRSWRRRIRSEARQEAPSTMIGIHGTGKTASEGIWLLDFGHVFDKRFLAGTQREREPSGGGRYKAGGAAGPGVSWRPPGRDLLVRGETVWTGERDRLVRGERPSGPGRETAWS
ncbi:hypothetical protein NHX12_005659 [Muraenolepis orangiensis]|uniref:Uncharacterized protein n=1 Tax=Muraenolepis orangiensis TaxID=630683 RepID=A0A9Q0DRR6_9TELE|nr:hypothetical protein NHX12_005659 [Muraenolepis orangiensis]